MSSYQGARGRRTTVRVSRGACLSTSLLIDTLYASASLFGPMHVFVVNLATQSLRSF